MMASPLRSGIRARSSSITSKIVSASTSTQQQRSLFTLLRRPAVSSSLMMDDNKDNTKQQRQSDLDHAVHMVRQHDPVGYLPGRLLASTTNTYDNSNNMMQTTYFAVRSFWVETGLRFGTTALVKSPNASPLEHLEWWQEGIESVYNKKNENASSVSQQHPTLRLISHLNDNIELQQQQQQQENGTNSSGVGFTKCHFDDILKGRFRDLDLKQYPNLASLEEHAEWSCASLAQLVLESNGIYASTHPVSHQAAKLVGKAHGLTNALRTSIPVVSTTGKLVIPQDLCEKYGVKSPRYLLSALGQGDVQCIHALKMTVQEIVMRARGHLQDARDLHPQIKWEAARANSKSAAVSAVLLPGLASETFLNRLEQHDYNLTDRDLRHVSFVEHAKCAANMIRNSYQNTY